MLYHTKCGSQVGIKGGAEIISQLSIDTSKKTLTTTGYIIIKVKKPANQNFYCADCGEEISKEDIYTTCAICGERLIPEDGNVLQGAGAVLCNSHVSRYSRGESTYKLSEIINSLGVK